MKHMWKRILMVSGALMLALSLAAPAFADEPAQAGPAAAVDAVEDQGEGMTTGMKAIAVALAIGIAAGGGGIGMGLAKSAEGISRQPEAEGKIRTMMMLGLVFIETAIIYALLVVILIIFVL